MGLDEADEYYNAARRSLKEVAVYDDTPEDHQRLHKDIDTVLGIYDELVVERGQGIDLALIDRFANEVVEGRHDHPEATKPEAMAEALFDALFEIVETPRGDQTFDLKTVYIFESPDDDMAASLVEQKARLVREIAKHF